jgi:putative component of toxin-antitoxin plasmid stabilization module
MKYRIETTKQYDLWFKKLKDASSRIKILARLVRAENGKMKNDLGNKIF